MLVQVCTVGFFEFGGIWENECWIADLMRRELFGFTATFSEEDHAFLCESVFDLARVSQEICPRKKTHCHTWPMRPPLERFELT